VAAPLRRPRAARTVARGWGNSEDSRGASCKSGRGRTASRLVGVEETGRDGRKEGDEVEEREGEWEWAKEKKNLATSFFWFCWGGGFTVPPPALRLFHEMEPRRGRRAAVAVG
jgi:hypothetical protein